jgi:hypothetical protein
VADFAGLWATRALARDDVRITLIDRRNHHLFQPLLYQVATAGLSAPDIARHCATSCAGNAMSKCSWGSRRHRRGHRSVTLADGDTLGFDYLLLASGATHAYFGHDDWARHAPGLKTLDDALAIRRRCCWPSSEPKPRIPATNARPGSTSPWSAVAPPASNWLAPWPKSHATPCATSSATSIRPKPGCACSKPVRACWRRFPNRYRRRRARNCNDWASKS